MVRRIERFSKTRILVPVISLEPPGKPRALNIRALLSVIAGPSITLGFHLSLSGTWSH